MTRSLESGRSREAGNRATRPRHCGSVPGQRARVTLVDTQDVSAVHTPCRQFDWFARSPSFNCRLCMKSLFGLLARLHGLPARLISCCLLCWIVGCLAQTLFAVSSRWFFGRLWVPLTVTLVAVAQAVSVDRQLIMPSPTLCTSSQFSVWSSVCSPHVSLIADDGFVGSEVHGLLKTIVVCLN